MGAMDGCNSVIHGAASVSSYGQLEESMRVNVEGTKNVLMAARRTKSVNVVIHVGTEAGCINSNGDPLKMLTEETPLPEIPFNGIYSTTKNLAEKAALSFDSPSLRVIAVRPRFIWGNDDTVILPIIAEAARSGVLQWFDGGNTYMC